MYSGMAEKTHSVLSSRQKIRKVILILTFILIPLTIFYVSPIVIMMGASEGIVSGSMILFILLFLLSLFVGRLWCGWLCPMGAWQELCSPVMKRTVKEGRLNYIKYIITVIWLAVIANAFFSAGGIRGIDPFYGTVNGISISSVDVLMVVGMIFFIIFVVAFITGKRGTCHVVCPIAGIMVAGRTIRNRIGWPALQLNADTGLCIDCNKCQKECPMGLDVHGMVRQKKMENPDCILCAHCSDICPKGAITYSITGKKN